MGGWTFEPHDTAGKTDHTRARWVVLALCLDLEEKLANHALEHAALPTKLTLSWQGCGANPHPGPGHRAGPTHSRTLPLPPAALASAAVRGGAMRGGVRFTASDRFGCGEAVLSPETLYLEGLLRPGLKPRRKRGSCVSTRVSTVRRRLHRRRARGRRGAPCARRGGVRGTRRGPGAPHGGRARFVCAAARLEPRSRPLKR